MKNKYIKNLLTFFLVISIFLGTASMYSGSEQNKYNSKKKRVKPGYEKEIIDSLGWKLIWQDNFDKNTIDWNIWSKIPRGIVDWDKHMSDYDSLYAVKDGNLILRGVVNTIGDTIPYLTGGLYTKNKKPFYRGKIEISARFENAQGAWPAFWLLPFDGTKWPSGGEIDIMERLNSDAKIYQTVHSYYTHTLKQTTNPKQGTTASIKQGEYNTYAVELWQDSLVFSVNGQRTFNYPRIETDKEGQFPFDREMYLLLDMQLGGSWVGEVKKEDLPVAMYIDWVRFYQKVK